MLDTKTIQVDWFQARTFGIAHCGALMLALGFVVEPDEDAPKYCFKGRDISLLVAFDAALAASGKKLTCPVLEYIMREELQNLKRKEATLVLFAKCWCFSCAMCVCMFVREGIVVSFLFLDCVTHRVVGLYCTRLDYMSCVETPCKYLNQYPVWCSQTVLDSAAAPPASKSLKRACLLDPSVSPPQPAAPPRDTIVPPSSPVFPSASLPASHPTASVSPSRSQAPPAQALDDSSATAADEAPHPLLRGLSLGRGFELLPSSYVPLPPPSPSPAPPRPSSSVFPDPSSTRPSRTLSDQIPSPAPAPTIDANHSPRRVFPPSGSSTVKHQGDEGT
jgi:hypothetical protein